MIQAEVDGTSSKIPRQILKGLDVCLFQTTHIDIEQFSGALTKQAPQVPHGHRNAWWRGWLLPESWHDDKSPTILAGVVGGGDPPVPPRVEGKQIHGPMDDMK